MLCKGGSLLITGTLQWLQWYIQTFFSILLLVLLVSWKQGHSMIESWCPFPLQWCFSLSFLALGSLQGPSEGCLQHVYLGQINTWCCDPEVFGQWWDTCLLRAIRESPAAAAYVQSHKNPSNFLFLLGKAFGEDGVRCGFKPSWKLDTTHLLAQPPSLPPTHPGGMGRRIEVKLVCWGKSCLIIENKVKNSNNGKR